MKKKIIAVIIIGLIIFAGIRICTSSYENAHREKSAPAYTSSLMKS